jgi:signal transduction histidine kinase
MEQIVKDTLTLARQGQTVGEMNPISLAELVKKCWDSIETDTASVDVTDEITIQGDSSRLRHVFENLFRNAIEHGNDDVTIHVGYTDDGRLYVEDNGSGIPPKERKKVLEAGHASAAGGTGVGLTIVKRIAEAHGWTVSITEARGGGARFEFDNVIVIDDE